MQTANNYKKPAQKRDHSGVTVPGMYIPVEEYRKPFITIAEKDLAQSLAQNYPDRETRYDIHPFETLAQYIYENDCTIGLGRDGSFLLVSQHAARVRAAKTNYRILCKMALTLNSKRLKRAQTCFQTQCLEEDARELLFLMRNVREEQAEETQASEKESA